MLATPINEIPAIRDSLRASFRGGLPRPLEWRKQQILQVARMVQDNREAFADALEKDVGKPKPEAFLHEIGSVVERGLFSARHLEEWAKPDVLDVPDWQKPWKPTVYKQAKGVVLIIAPWNFPVTLALQPFIGAIAAGCCAVLKPSEISSHCAALFAELFPKYLDPNAYRVILGGVPEITAVLELQWDHIFYTGNSRIARVISMAAAKHLTPLTLELGGKVPVIVDPSFDLTLAAKRILWAKTQNCGQFCVAPDYVLVPRTHQDEFITGLKAAYAEFFPEGSMNSDSIARIVSSEHHARLTEMLKRSKGHVVFGGGSDTSALKIEVTVLKDVSEDDSLMEGEIFGPVLPIVPVENMDRAIEFVRDRDHPLVLYAFTEHQEVKKRIIDETMSGSVVFNDLVSQLAVDSLPFGGVGESGYGRQITKFTFDAFSYERSSIEVAKELEPYNEWRYPPYTEEKSKIFGAAVGMPIPERC